MAIDPPWRLDPFQNIVNVQSGDRYLVAFTLITTHWQQKPGGGFDKTSTAATTQYWNAAGEAVGAGDVLPKGYGSALGPVTVNLTAVSPFDVTVNGPSFNPDVDGWTVDLGSLIESAMSQLVDGGYAGADQTYNPPFAGAINNSVRSGTVVVALELGDFVYQTEPDGSLDGTVTPQMSVVLAGIDLTLGQVIWSRIFKGSVVGSGDTYQVGLGQIQSPPP